MRTAGMPAAYHSNQLAVHSCSGLDGNVILADRCKAQSMQPACETAVSWVVQARPQRSLLLSSPGPGSLAPAPASTGLVSCTLMKAFTPALPLDTLTPGGLLLLAHTWPPQPSSWAHSRPAPSQQPYRPVAVQAAPLGRQALVGRGRQQPRLVSRQESEVTVAGQF